MATATQERSDIIPFDRAIKDRHLAIMRTRPTPPQTVDDEAPNAFVAEPELEAWIRSTFIDDQAQLCNADHQHLQFARIGFLWTNVSYRKQQRWIVGQAENPKNNTGGAWKKGQREQQLSEWFGSVPDFVITLHAPALKDFDDRSFCAVIEHELYHCAQDTTDTGAPRFHLDGSPMFAIRDHDVNEFFGVAARYGLTRDLKALVELSKQQPQIPDNLIEGVCGTCLAKAA
jgi:hypothetical protein